MRMYFYKFSCDGMMHGFQSKYQVKTMQAGRNGTGKLLIETIKFIVMLNLRLLLAISTYRSRMRLGLEELRR
jgi:hypothetical protein